MQVYLTVNVERKVWDFSWCSSIIDVYFHGIKSKNKNHSVDNVKKLHYYYRR